MGLLIDECSKVCEEICGIYVNVFTICKTYPSIVGKAEYLYTSSYHILSVNNSKYSTHIYMHNKDEV